MPIPYNIGQNIEDTDQQKQFIKRFVKKRLTSSAIKETS